MSTLNIATIARSQDYTTIKHNEDNRAAVQQTMISQQIHKDVEQRAREVRSGDNTEWQNKKFDAKEKGSNEYSGNGGDKRRKKEETGRMVVKGRSGFDMKI